MPKKIKIEQWKAQQRLYEHSEKLNQSTAHNSNKNTCNARQRAQDMHTYAPLLDIMTSGGEARNGSFDPSQFVNTVCNNNFTAPPF